MGGSSPLIAAVNIGGNPLWHQCRRRRLLLRHRFQSLRRRDQHHRAAHRVAVRGTGFTLGHVNNTSFNTKPRSVGSVPARNSCPFVMPSSSKSTPASCGSGGNCLHPTSLPSLPSVENGIPRFVPTKGNEVNEGRTWNSRSGAPIARELRSFLSSPHFVAFVAFC